MTYMVSSRVLVLNAHIKTLDREIAFRRDHRKDASDLEAERKRLADEAMAYLSRAVKVKSQKRGKGK